MFASNFEAAATEIRSLFLNSYNLTIKKEVKSLYLTKGIFLDTYLQRFPSSLSQNEQSAAPPAIVPKR